MQDVKTKNYYELLGVERNATLREIKTAYRDIARVYHPDSNFYADIIDSKLSAENVEIFKLITAAYHTLSHQEKREAYDRTLGEPIEDWDRPGDNAKENKKDTSRNHKNARTAFTFGQSVNEARNEENDQEFNKTRPMSEIINEGREKFQKELVKIFVGVICFFLTIIIFLLVFRR